MTPTDLARTQRAILDAIKRTGPVALDDDDIADVAGVSRPTVSKWRAGVQPFRIGELDRLAQRFGAPVVYGALAGRARADVVTRANALVEPATAALVALDGLVASLGALTPAVHPASPGGAAVVGVEWESVDPALDRVQAAIDALRALRPASPQTALPMRRPA